LPDRRLYFVYEAGPCGFGIHRHLTARGEDCVVVSPSMIPKRSGDRVKTDRRDSQMLARLHRAGELRAIYIPDATDEAMRDLVRAREDAVVVGTQAKYRLKAFLLRQGRRYPGREGWTLPYRRWLTDLSFPSAAQHIALQEYRDAIAETEQRIERLTEQLRQLAPAWRWAPVVAALQARRGVSFLTALVAELGDLTPFGHPRELMAYLGLVPSEHSSGPTVRRGGITKAGNPHVRRLLAEAAWAYHGIPRIGRQHAYRQEALPKVVCDIAWKTQLRLTTRFKRLVARARRSRRSPPRSRGSCRGLSGQLRGRCRPRPGNRRRGGTDRTSSFIDRFGGTVTRWRILEVVKGGRFGGDVRG
jgi:transposase